jgi:hypothetical protein
VSFRKAADVHHAPRLDAMRSNDGLCATVDMSSSLLPLPQTARLEYASPVQMIDW